MNMINSILGSGIIGMPYTLKQAGIGLGVIFILIMGIATGTVKYFSELAQ